MLIQTEFLDPLRTPKGSSLVIKRKINFSEMVRCYFSVKNLHKWRESYAMYRLFNYEGS